MNHPNRSLHKPRPRILLESISRQYPGLWQAVDIVRGYRNVKIKDWPNWTFMAGELWPYVMDQVGVPPLDMDARQAIDAIGQWRPSQGIYRFDPALYDCIISTPLDGEIPCDVLYRLPEWSCYIEAPGLQWVTGSEVFGVFVSLQHFVTTGETRLELAADTAEGVRIFPIELSGGTLRDTAYRTLRKVISPDSESNEIIENERKMETLYHCLAPMLSLALYLCTVNAEIGDGSRKPKTPLPKRTKKGWRLFPPDQPVVWDVGVRMGAALRAAFHQREMDAEGTGTTVRPHVRRSHWHGYWTGPKATPELRKLALKWLPPIPVNVDNVEQLVPTIRPVA